MTTPDIRHLIDDAKRRAAIRDAEPITIQLGDHVEIPVKRSRPRGEKLDEIDPSNVAIVSEGNTYVPALTARLYTIRAEKRALSAEEDAIKDVLLSQAGELEYIALAEGEAPILSLKHEESVRVNTEWVKENLPTAEHPEAWKRSTSRPLRLMD